MWAPYFPSQAPVRIQPRPPGGLFTCRFSPPDPQLQPSWGHMSILASHSPRPLGSLVLTTPRAAEIMSGWTVYLPCSHFPIRIGWHFKAASGAPCCAVMGDVVSWIQSSQFDV